MIYYWSIENGDPVCAIDGTHCFELVDEKIVFTQQPGRLCDREQ